MANVLPSYFHLHLISDATGETLTTIAKAAAVQYAQVRPIEHVHPLVRTPRQLERVLQEIASAPGIVLYTVVKVELQVEIERRCRDLKVPCLHVLEPIMKVFESYLGQPQTPIVAGQHVLDADYFRRIDAMHFVLAHDDGQAQAGIAEADVCLVGVSRSSKTPTSFYLANRGVKAANVPLVPGLMDAPGLENPVCPVVGLTLDADALIEIRRHRLRMIGTGANTGAVRQDTGDYVDQEAVKAELLWARRLCTRRGWPVIDVTRRSIEETAATVLQLMESWHERRRKEATASL